jgi:cell division protein FtsQ
MRWLKRKSGNQRLRSRSVLDVKLATAQVYRRRCHVLFYAGAAALGVIFTLYVCWRAGDVLLDRLVFANDSYAIQILDVRTDGVLAVEQLRRWAGVKEGDNLFALDLLRIKRDLELIPAIQRVAVERLLPRTLRIRVEEREPVAQIITTIVRADTAAQSVVCLLDGAGHAMLPLESWQRAMPANGAEQYPVISGASPAQLSPGRRVESPQIRAALRLIEAFEHSPMAGLVELKRIDVSSAENMVVTTDQHGEVALGAEELERQLARWRAIYDAGLLQGRQIGSLDLSVADNIPLRWQEAATPPVAPKPRKPSPYKKKHV